MIDGHGRCENRNGPGLCRAGSPVTDLAGSRGGEDGQIVKVVEIFWQGGG
jgi:hypothetical protein